MILIGREEGMCVVFLFVNIGMQIVRGYDAAHKRSGLSKFIKRPVTEPRTSTLTLQIEHLFQCLRF